MISYKELGLVNTKELFAKAVKGDMRFPLLISITLNRCRQL